MTVEQKDQRAGRSLLHTLRKRAGLNQAALGERVGTSGNAIGHYERGERPLPYEVALRLARELGCAAADLMPDAIGLSVPLTLRIASAFSENRPDSFDIDQPWPRVPGGLALDKPEDCFAAQVVDDSADMLYPPGSILVVREPEWPHRLPLGAKVVVRRHTGEGRARRTMEVLVGFLDLSVAGETVLSLRTHNPELPASVLIAAPPRPGLAESAEALHRPADVLYQPEPGDRAEILGVVELSIKRE